MTTLDDALFAAHAAGDAETLVAIYQQAAAAADTTDEVAFFLTHAYIFALEIDHPEAEALREKLIKAGRETSLGPRIPPKR